MGVLARILGYGTLGAAKVSARRAWESDDYVESALTAAQAGVLAEAARELLTWDDSDIPPEDEF